MPDEKRGRQRLTTTLYMNSFPCQAFLFDMDGVLIDSTPVVTRVWANWAIKHGFNPAEVVARALGRPSIATVRDYLPNSDHHLENSIIEKIEMEDVEGIVPLPGARELLSKLPPERWTIVTSSTKPLAEVRLRAAGLAKPAHLVTASDIVRGKPDPEPYLKGAAKLGVRAEDCVVVEDVAAGVQAGKAAGCKVIAVRGSTTDDALRGAGADWVLDNCAQIDVKPNGANLQVLLQQTPTEES